MTRSEPALPVGKPTSEPVSGLFAYGNATTVLEGQPVRSEISGQVLEYVRTMRNAEVLLPHQLTAGFFASEHPERGSHEAYPPVEPTAQRKPRPRGDRHRALTHPQERSKLGPNHDARGPMRVVRAPLGSVPQSTWLLGPPLSRKERLLLRELEPDSGRRVQLWWDELPPHPRRGGPDQVVQFLRLAEWLGRVDEVSDDRFSATLRDRSAPGIVEVAEFFVEQLAVDDRSRLGPGAFFYWTVGYAETASGGRTAVSRLRMRRVRRQSPDWPRPDAAGEDATFAMLDRSPDPD